MIIDVLSNIHWVCLFLNLFLRLYCTIMFIEWNGGQLFLYNGLSRNAQRRVFVDCAALFYNYKDEGWYLDKNTNERNYIIHID